MKLIMEFTRKNRKDNSLNKANKNFMVEICLADHFPFATWSAVVSQSVHLSEAN